MGMAGCSSQAGICLFVLREKISWGRRPQMYTLRLTVLLSPALVLDFSAWSEITPREEALDGNGPWNCEQETAQVESLQDWCSSCSNRTLDVLVNKWSYSTAHLHPFFLLCSRAFKRLKLKLIFQGKPTIGQQEKIVYGCLRWWGLIKLLKPLHLSCTHNRG